MAWQTGINRPVHQFHHEIRVAPSGGPGAEYPRDIRMVHHRLRAGVDCEYRGSDEIDVTLDLAGEEVATGSIPLLMMAGKAAGDARNLINALAA